MLKSGEEAKEYTMNRVKKNDPAAMTHLAKAHCNEGGVETALEYWTKSAELGDAEAHHNLSCFYRKGQGFETDEKKEMYHLRGGNWRPSRGKAQSWMYGGGKWQLGESKETLHHCRQPRCP